MFHPLRAYRRRRQQRATKIVLARLYQERAVLNAARASRLSSAWDKHVDTALRLANESRAETRENGDQA